MRQYCATSAHSSLERARGESALFQQKPVRVYRALITRYVFRLFHNSASPLINPRRGIPASLSLFSISPIRKCKDMVSFSFDASLSKRLWTKTDETCIQSGRKVRESRSITAFRNPPGFQWDYYSCVKRRSPPLALVVSGVI